MNFKPKPFKHLQSQTVWLRPETLAFLKAWALHENVPLALLIRQLIEHMVSEQVAGSK